jgi:lantibiotic transport system ATP-binding protein
LSDAIATHGLKRRFGRLVAVDGLDLRVPAGTVTAFLGPNGAGKTTTIRLLLGLLRPDAGRVDLFGMPLAASREALLRRVGALVETPALYRHLSGRDNLELSRRRLGLAAARIDQVLEVVDLTEDAGRPVDQYSLGMRQRLGLALALIAEPELLILDEPTNGLDPAGIREMRSLIRRFADEHGMTVFLSSHLLAEVAQVCDRLAVIHRGRLAFQGTVDELRTARRGEIAVGVERAGDAAAALRQQGWTVTVDGEALHVEGAGREAAATICRQLVESGFAVHHLAETRATLESTFLDLTDGDRAETRR